MTFLRILALATALAATIAPAIAQDFPLTIEHKFGSTTIAQKPVRVASIDFNGADNVLALGVQPVMVRYWFGGYDIWPWAERLLEEKPEMLRGEPNFEQIAAVEPDVILALYSGITDKDYQLLSTIAPVVAVPEGVDDYALAWDQQALIAGRALGMEEQAATQVQAIKDELAAIADRHPDWSGRTVTLGTTWDGANHVYTESDPRVQFLNQMGLVNHPEVVALSSTGAFSVEVSDERPEVFDADVLIWFADEGMEQIENAIFRPTLNAVKEGREIFLGPLLTSALSHTSLLSLPYALDVLEPSIELAIDGDPATEVPVAP